MACEERKLKVIMYWLLHYMCYLNKHVFSNKSYPIQGAFCSKGNIFHSPQGTQTTIANVKHRTNFN